jgi:hypothetical protein
MCANKLSAISFALELGILVNEPVKQMRLR